MNGNTEIKHRCPNCGISFEEDEDVCQECGHKFDKNKYIEVEPDPNCKVCNGNGYKPNGEDCKCIWKKVK